jgi:hypothetical protein
LIFNQCCGEPDPCYQQRGCHQLPLRAAGHRVCPAQVAVLVVVPVAMLAAVLVVLLALVVVLALRPVKGVGVRPWTGVKGRGRQDQVARPGAPLREPPGVAAPLPRPVPLQALLAPLMWSQRSWVWMGRHPARLNAGRSEAPSPACSPLPHPLTQL